MARSVGILQYWGGCPKTPNSKWQRVLRTVQRCAERGWRSHLVWSRMPEDPGLSRPFREAGCEIILQRRAKRNFDLRCVIDTFRMLRRICCDIFHCHNVHTSPLLGAALARVPVRIWSKLSMSPYYEQGVEPRGIHRLAPSTRLSCALASRVFALSEAVKKEIVDLGVCQGRIAVVRAPVEVKLVSASSAQALRRSLEVRRGDILVTTVGHAVPVKGWDVLIQAFSEIAHSLPRAHLLLVGGTDGPDEIPFFRQLRALVEELGLQQQVRFVGQRSDIAEILSATDVFAFPSRSDGQGLALTEALVLGLPCVASATGGIPELIRHGRNGLLFPREDVPSLAGNLRALIQSESLRRRLGQEARKARGKFTIDTHVEAVLDQYQALLGAASSGDLRRCSPN